MLTLSATPASIRLLADIELETGGSLYLFWSIGCSAIDKRYHTSRILPSEEGSSILFSVGTLAMSRSIRCRMFDSKFSVLILYAILFLCL